MSRDPHEMLRYKIRRYAGRSHMPCDWCEVSIFKTDATVDHIQPIACGGGNDYENLKLSCKRCNDIRNMMQIALARGRFCVLEADILQAEAWLDTCGFLDTWIVGERLSEVRAMIERSLRPYVPRDGKKRQKKRFTKDWRRDKRIQMSYKLAIDFDLAAWGME